MKEMSLRQTQEMPTNVIEEFQGQHQRKYYPFSNISTTLDGKILTFDMGFLTGNKSKTHHHKATAHAKSRTLFFWHVYKE